MTQHPITPKTRTLPEVSYLRLETQGLMCRLHVIHKSIRFPYHDRTDVNAETNQQNLREDLCLSSHRICAKLETRRLISLLGCKV